MQDLVRRITGIREGEGLRAGLMFIYIFFVIASLLIVKPIRNSLFITRYGAGSLPYVYLLVAVAAAVVTFSYTRLIQRMRLSYVIFGTLLLSILMFTVFFHLLHAHITPGWLVYAFYVWVQIFGMIATTQFWLLANYVFNTREAKRLFGFIGAGAISGGIAGGYLTRWLVPTFGTVNLLLFCIGFLLVNVLVLRSVWIRSGRQKLRERKPQPLKPDADGARTTPVLLVLSSPYLRLIAGIVGVGVIVATLVDYQFSAIASANIKDRDGLTGFFGFWLSNLSILSLLVQIFLTSRILANLGVGASLFFLPMGILGGAAAVFLQPAVWSAVLTKMADGGFKQSINKAGLELLYLPLPSYIKNQAKAFIDVFVDSFAGGLGGILLIVFTIYLGMDARAISLMILAFIALWLCLLIMMQREYVNTFRVAIEKRTIDLEDQRVNLDDASLQAFVSNIMSKGSSRNILYVLHLVESSRNPKWIEPLRKLLLHHSAEIRAQVLQILPNFSGTDFTEDIRPLITDPDDDVRVLAIQYIYKNAPERRAALDSFLNDERIEIRSAAMRVSAMESRSSGQFRKVFSMESALRQMMESVQEAPGNSDKNFVKETAARVVGTAGDPKLFPYLHVLINDPASEVQRAAIQAAGETEAPEFVSVLIRHLDVGGVRKTAREALADYGEAILDRLVAAMTDSNERKSVRLRIPGVIALIGTQPCMDALTTNLDNNDLFLRYEVIKGMGKLHKADPNLKVDESRVTRRILQETDNYYRIGAVLSRETRRILPVETEGVKQARRLLIRALEERLDYNLERIFRLLGLKYPPTDMFNAYRGIVSRRDDLRANAVEFLDNVLDMSLKKLILPIVETRQAEAMLDSVIERGTAEQRGEETILSLLDDDDQWIQVCVLHLLAQQKERKASAQMARLMNSPDPTVRETAAYALRAVQFPMAE